MISNLLLLLRKGWPMAIAVEDWRLRPKWRLKVDSCDWRRMRMKRNLFFFSRIFCMAEGEGERNS